MQYSPLSAGSTPVSRLALAVAFLFAISACQTGAEREVVAIEEILDEPTEYVGQQVTVSGTIAQVFGPHAFSIGGQGAERQLLVVSLDSVQVVPPRTHDMPFVANDSVQVTGSVRMFDREEIEEELRGQVSPELQAYDGLPAIVASSGAAQMESVLVTPQDVAEKR